MIELAQFAAAVRACGPRWEQSGIRWQFTFGPVREKSAAQVDCQRGTLLGELIVWDTGEAELAVADVTTDVIDRVHHDLANAQELVACLDDLTARLLQQS
ncbi:hypothetical protein [Kutzneria sp. 744]|uniref:hypothetical protein n=1 Tax=Kutzneria sp. (strain 744) TaxID=345341 RepID=UPI0003EEB944|nr:hypothetical protein [Kutzneria sp. 744]EWM12713.1 hypothetical protein KUTG_03017 [Kutzneria sp. 744]